MDDWSSGGYRFETHKSEPKPSPPPVPSVAEAASPPEPPVSPPADDFDEEMARFEAECARRLEEEHKRQAKEAKSAEIAKAAEEARTAAGFDVGEAAFSEIAKPKPPHREEPPSQEDAPPEMSMGDELAAIMQNESNERHRHEEAMAALAQDEFYEEEEAFDEFVYDDEDDDETLPKWLRLLFTVLLLALGAGGTYIMVGMDYRSYLLDPLCFAEVSLCMLTAIGLHTALMESRISRVFIMKTAALFLFLFYCLYAAYHLFLHRMLADRFVLGNYLYYARDHVSGDFSGGMEALGKIGMAECAVFIVPFAFLLLMIFRPCRHILIYGFGMVMVIFGVAALRIVAMAGPVNIAQGVMAMVGALAAYLVYYLPPVHNVMEKYGFAPWVEEYDED